MTMDEEINEAVNDFYLVIEELSKEYTLNLSTSCFGMTAASIKIVYPNEIPVNTIGSTVPEYIPCGTIEIENIITFSPSGKITVAWKEGSREVFLYKIKKGKEISFLMEDSLDEKTCLKNNRVFQQSRKIAERIKQILAPNSVQFIKEL